MTGEIRSRSDETSQWEVTSSKTLSANFIYLSIAIRRRYLANVDVHCKAARELSMKRNIKLRHYIAIISLHESILDSIFDNISRTKNVFSTWLKVISRRDIPENYILSISRL